MYSVAKPKRFNIKTFLFLFFASPKKRTKERGLFQYVFFRLSEKPEEAVKFPEVPEIFNTPSSFSLKKEGNLWLSVK